MCLIWRWYKKKKEKEKEKEEERFKQEKAKYNLLKSNVLVEVENLREAWIKSGSDEDNFLECYSFFTRQIRYAVNVKYDPKDKSEEFYSYEEKLEEPKKKRIQSLKTMWTRDIIAAKPGIEVLEYLTQADFYNIFKEDFFISYNEHLIFDNRFKPDYVDVLKRLGLEYKYI